MNNKLLELRQNLLEDLTLKNVYPLFYNAYRACIVMIHAIQPTDGANFLVYSHLSLSSVSSNNVDFYIVFLDSCGGGAVQVSCVYFVTTRKVETGNHQLRPKHFCIL